MLKLMTLIADHLMTAARNRAERAMASVAPQPICQDNIYRSNLGGWN